MPFLPNIYDCLAAQLTGSPQPFRSPCAVWQVSACTGRRMVGFRQGFEITHTHRLKFQLCPNDSRLAVQVHVPWFLNLHWMLTHGWWGIVHANRQNSIRHRVKVQLTAGHCESLSSFVLWSPRGLFHRVRNSSQYIWARSHSIVKGPFKGNCLSTPVSWGLVFPGGGEHPKSRDCTACALLAGDAIYHGLWEKPQMPNSSLGRSNISCYMNKIREREGG